MYRKIRNSEGFEPTFDRNTKMNKDEFENVAQRLKEINDVVKGLDESIRPSAFAVLETYATGDTWKVDERPKAPGKKVKENREKTEPLVDSDDAGSFIEKHLSDKAADNVKALAAYIYSVYGNVDFKATEIAEIAHEVGVPVPDRVDVTLGHASVDKKSLFQKRRPGVYRPTANGRKFFKDEYSVTPGTAKRPEMS